MILVAGGTGRMGTELVGLLRRRGLPVRVLTRDPSRATHLVGDGVEVAAGDVADVASLRRAIHGVETVVSAIQGFAGPGKPSPATVDREGNHNLIQAVREAGAGQFILVSVADAAPDHPMDLMRMKYAAEQDLKASGVPWTIIRPSAFIETWADLLCRPLVARGKTQIFGRGDNPVNFVAASDVAHLVELAIVDPGLRSQTIEVFGPENLSTTQLVKAFQSITGRPGNIAHVPPAAMRVGATVMRMLNPRIARQIQAGIVMDTAPMARDASERRTRFPSVPVTSLAEVIRRDYLDSSPTVELAASS